MAELSIAVTPGTPPVLSLSGEVDLFTAPDLESAMQNALGQDGAVLALDLSRVTYLDSSGIGAIVRAVKRCRELGGELRIVGISDRALRLMQLLSLDRVIRFYPNGTLRF